MYLAPVFTPAYQIPHYLDWCLSLITCLAWVGNRRGNVVLKQLKANLLNTLCQCLITVLDLVFYD